MKKVLFILVLLTSFSNYAQGADGKKHEVHLNALNMIAFKWIDLSYEYIINEESSAGSSFSTNFSDEPIYLFSYSRKYAVTPYYRYFVGQENAMGLFGEVFSMINGGEVREKVEPTEKADDSEQEYKYTDYNDLAFGLGAGYKHVSNMGLTLQAYGGIGRNLFSKEAPVVVIRAGVTLGYRF